MCGNNPDLIQGYISPIRGRRKPEMSERTPPITPHENDILMGRGGKNNQHSGNNQLRALARQECRSYRVSSKKGKSHISRELVRRVREMDPPGRFLKKNNNTGLWEDVGDDVAREKASQALRDAVALEQHNEEQSDEEEQAEEEEEEQEEYEQPIPVSQAFRRTLSAPPVMDKSPTDERRKTWPVQERLQQPRQDAQQESTPHYPSVTPASLTMSAPAKRRRYYEESDNSPWAYQPEHPPYRSPDFAPSRSNPEMHRPDFQPSYPTQQARRPYHPQQQQQQQYPAQQQYQHSPYYHHYPHGTGAPPPPPPPEEDFDLFNGQLLEPPARGAGGGANGGSKGGLDDTSSLERRSDTF